ncbi:MAG: DUF642 domain-containing protein [Armatimonadetes bacterium]|nr:DUF642 domain-containing protein [Armatimonadota bacterium]
MKGLLGFVFGVGFAGFAHANLIVNGGFEQGAWAPGGDNSMQLFGGSGAIMGWSVTGDEIAWIGSSNPYFVSPSEGQRFLDLAGYNNNGSPGGIQQTFATTIGQQYLLTFDHGASNLYGASKIVASAAGTTQSWTLTSGATNLWEGRSMVFTATSTSTTLSIAEDIQNVGGSVYQGVDNVSVVAVPEPSTILALSLGAVALLRRRKK